jgi:hypothetical protein
MYSCWFMLFFLCRNHWFFLSILLMDLFLLQRTISLSKLYYEAGLNKGTILAWTDMYIILIWKKYPVRTNLQVYHVVKHQTKLAFLIADYLKEKKIGRWVVWMSSRIGSVICVLSCVRLVSAYNAA